MNNIKCKCGAISNAVQRSHICPDFKRSFFTVYIPNASKGKNTNPEYRKRFGSRAV